MDSNMKLILVGVIALLIGFIAGGFFIESDLTGEAGRLLQQDKVIQNNYCGNAVNYSDFSQGLNACMSEGFSEAECKSCMYEHLFEKLNETFEQERKSTPGYTPPGSILEKCRHHDKIFDWVLCIWSNLID